MCLSFTGEQLYPACDDVTIKEQGFPEDIIDGGGGALGVMEEEGFINNSGEGLVCPSGQETEVGLRRTRVLKLASAMRSLGHLRQGAWA